MSHQNGTPHRALVVGTGFGCRIQVPALRGAGFDVVGLVGTDAKRTERRADSNGVPHGFTDLDAAISQTGATVVAIASPPGTHHAQTLIAVGRGCHVICEKPFAASLTQARAMRQAAEQAGVVNLVGHEFRYVPQRALIAKTIADGLIGAPRFFTSVQYISFVNSYAAGMPRWWFDPDTGGGWLGASGSHAVDQIRAELGEFASVSASLPKVSAAAGQVEDSFIVRFRLTNGVEGMLQQTAGAVGPVVNMFRIAGTEATLWTEGDSVWIADGAGSRELAVPAELVLPPPPPPSTDKRQASEEWQWLAMLELAPYTELCRNFRQLIDGETLVGARRPASFADGVACISVLDAIRKSAAQDGALIEVEAF